MRIALALVAIAGTGTVASAGTFIGLGVGTAPSVSDSENTQYGSDGRSLRLTAGYGFELSKGRLSVEGAYGGFGYIQNNTPGSDGRYDSRTLQVAAKYNYPLGNNFEVFGRAGLLRTDLNPHNQDLMSYSGNGYLLGLGIEYRLPAFASIFIDYTRNAASFDQTDRSPQWDETASMWMLGVNVNL